MAMHDEAVEQASRAPDRHAARREFGDLGRDCGQRHQIACTGRHVFRDQRLRADCFEVVACDPMARREGFARDEKKIGTVARIGPLDDLEAGVLDHAAERMRGEMIEVLVDEPLFHDVV